MPQTITLYRYLKAHRVIDALRDRRLRVSRYSDLNDPFEYTIWPITDDPSLRDAGLYAIKQHTDRLYEAFGIISMSAEIRDPVMWSHYADKHQGIALEFDFPHNEELYSLVYSHALPIFDVSKFMNEITNGDYVLSVLRGALARKSLSWGYEREHRIHCNLREHCEKDGENYFFPLPDGILKRVILGVNCKKSMTDVEQALKAGGFDNIPIVQSRKSETAYEILTD